MKAIDHLTDVIINSFSDSLDLKVNLIKREFKLEIERIKESAYNAGVVDGITKEADRIKEFSGKFTPPAKSS